ncbi:WecB/TagA/CpsF family glycosyltransferase [Spirosoma validum]|uniref:WecB/TagA/CpsF family glycosyltransferase n=1 Tax=Spirosoma validum TaxID=2771355 RepID=A0A927AYN6_9BACT|nr:WecB/TagA/CpsF family glycosyltransferase [Spirosoma validum]MBD2752284.1 WecB/TagA/CpsF family glycosyltransferase [Spirosoma validum]
MTKVLNVTLFDCGLDAAVHTCLEQCADSYQRENKCISATDAHGLVTAYRQPEFKALLDSFYWVMPDGMPSVLLGKWRGATQMTRCYGPDFFKQILTNSVGKEITHFFCGGKEGVADELKVAVSQKFGNHQVVGTFCPPFREMSDQELKELAQTINRSGANIVWIGLGTPKQERFAQRLSMWTNVHFLVTVGAAFDFHTDRVTQAPAWMQRLSLEWFFRLMVEPKRLGGRYFRVVPLFIWFNLKEAFRPSKSVQA